MFNNLIHIPTCFNNLLIIYLLIHFTAISTDGERLELSYDEKASSSPLRLKINVMNSPLIKSPLIVGTPSSLRSRKVFHLEAELGAERFDRNFLQEEVDRQSQRIVELGKSLSPNIILIITFYNTYLYIFQRSCKIFIERKYSGYVESSI